MLEVLKQRKWTSMNIDYRLIYYIQKKMLDFEVNEDEINQILQNFSN
jgi:hypothetical protein